MKPFTGIIKKSYPYIKVGLSGAAEISSFGLGGDEAIEFAFVVLDSLLLSSDLLILFDLNKNENFQDVMNDIINLKFEGINKLNSDYDNIMKKMSIIPNDIKNDLQTKLCSIFDKLLLKIGTLFGDLLSMGIPDDSDIASLTFQHFIKENIDNNINDNIKYISYLNIINYQKILLN